LFLCPFFYIVLSALLRYTVSDYPVVFFKLLLGLRHLYLDTKYGLIIVIFISNIVVEVDISSCVNDITEILLKVEINNITLTLLCKGESF